MGNLALGDQGIDGLMRKVNIAASPASFPQLPELTLTRGKSAVTCLEQRYPQLSPADSPAALVKCCYFERCVSKDTVGTVPKPITPTDNLLPAIPQVAPFNYL